MKTITIDISTVLYYILPPLVIYCIIYYGVLTDKYDRTEDTSFEIIYSLIITMLSSIIFFAIMEIIQMQFYHFMFTL